MTGKRYEYLTVVKQTSPFKCLCICQCGQEKEIYIRLLERGVHKSCGCKTKEMIGNATRTHGRSKMPGYSSWTGMKKRCVNKNCTEFHLYGGRGIKVCDRWLNSFENFIADMGDIPSSKHSIDRIDVNGNYTPENCRWANSTIQGLNQRLTRTTASGYRGVTLERTTGKWRARILVRRKSIFNGLYFTIQEAVIAREAALKAFYQAQADERAAA